MLSSSGLNQDISALVKGHARLAGEVDKASASLVASTGAGAEEMFVKRMKPFADSMKAKVSDLESYWKVGCHVIG
jgi:hypothetical protein